MYMTTIGVGITGVGIMVGAMADGTIGDGIMVGAMVAGTIGVGTIGVGITGIIVVSMETIGTMDTMVITMFTPVVEEHLNIQTGIPMPP
jgi:hypothetical protein